MTSATDICRPCLEGRHEECEGSVFEKAVKERRGILLDYHVDVVEPPPCRCDRGICRFRGGPPPAPPSPRSPRRRVRQGPARSPARTVQLQRLVPV